jgi:hypothetical protein
MRSSLIRSWLMASAGVAALSAGPAWAQQDAGCAERLDQMDRQLEQADVGEQRRADVQLVIDGARTLAETGDEQGCERVVGELDKLMQTVTGEAAQATPATGDQQAQGRQQPSDQAAGGEQTGTTAAGGAEEQTGKEQAETATPAAPAGSEPQTGEPTGTTAAAGSEPQAEKQKPEATAAAGSEQPDKRQTAAAAAESPLAQIPATELVGSEVVNEQGDTVAEIVDMVKRSDDETVYAVLSVGGFLGVGDKEVAMPLDRLDMGADQDIVLSNASEQELESMPPWQEDDPAYESLQ